MKLKLVTQLGMVFILVVEVLFAGVANSEQPSSSAAIGKASIKSPVVVELFTSQGCHSCPPADTYLGRLAEDDQIIALACHVTYWNYLGWNDTYSLPFCDERQHNYRDSLGVHSAYTPQMVINGRFEGVGSRQNRIEPLLIRAKNEVSVKMLSITENRGRLHIEAFDSVKLSGASSTVLLGLGGKAVVDIERGENWGRKLKYHRPVLAVYELDDVFDSQSTLLQEVEQREEIKMWVALIQDMATGVVVAAAKYDMDED